MPSGLRITVDKKRCASHQNCVRTVPAVFGLDADGKAYVIDEQAGERGAIVEAGLDCPTAAIDVYDAESGDDLLG
jgi:ferredoxin